MTDRPLNFVIKSVRVVRPHRASIYRLDLGVKDGRYARIAPDIPAAEASEVYDAGQQLGFPGVVDADTHVGIDAPPRRRCRHRAQSRGGRRRHRQEKI